MKKLSLLLLAAMLLLFACQTDYEEKARNPEFLHRSLTQLNEIIIYDIFPPPIASRIYAYSCIAAYEAGHYDQKGYKSLDGQLNGLTNLPKPEAGKEYCFSLAGVNAFLTVGNALTFSETEMEAFRQGLYKEYRKTGMPSEVYDRSMKYGESVAQAVLAWSKKDNYKETRTFPKFTVDETNPARWSPTPPDYKDAVEPHWAKIRPFTLDSAAQFLPPPPPTFSIDPKSEFIKETNAVKVALEGQAAQKKDREEIAYFWDDNPFVSHHVGHVMFASKKVTPGGHWMNITQLAARKTNADFAKSVQAYLYTSLCLADGFISCWHAKYTYNLIRPETVINKYIDEEWRPFLQTPNFPEHTSGHSVISRAAATALTVLFGDNFAFRDVTNEPYGRPARNFKSFVEASQEASISRFYGGIHYMPALTLGALQGEKVGLHVLDRVKTKE
jgi:hypothetical protein